MLAIHSHSCVNWIRAPSSCSPFYLRNVPYIRKSLFLNFLPHAPPFISEVYHILESLFFLNFPHFASLILTFPHFHSLPTLLRFAGPLVFPLQQSSRRVKAGGLGASVKEIPRENRHGRHQHRTKQVKFFVHLLTCFSSLLVSCHIWCPPRFISLIYVFIFCLIHFHQQGAH